MQEDHQTSQELHALNAILRTKTLTSTLIPIVLSLFIITILLYLGTAYFTSHGNPLSPARDSAYDIVKQLRETPELAVLNVSIEKLAVYDSEHQNSHWDFSAFLENKKEFCSIPVEISLQFGYDLSELSAHDITIDDSDPNNKAIEIRLPAPRIINSGYSLKYHLENSDKKPMCSSETGWVFKDNRQVRHGLKEAIRYQAYHEVLKEDWLPIFGKDVQQSTELFFTGILQNLGYKTVIIVAGQKS